MIAVAVLLAVGAAWWALRKRRQVVERRRLADEDEAMTRYVYGTVALWQRAQSGDPGAVQAWLTHRNRYLRAHGIEPMSGP